MLYVNRVACGSRGILVASICEAVPSYMYTIVESYCRDNASFS
jgi:hypothetical protein